MENPPEMRKVIDMKRIMAMLILVAAGTIASAQTAADWYIGKTIKDIRFEGLIVVPVKDLDPVIKEFKGKPFDDQLWMNLMARVYELDWFETIEPEAVPSDAKNTAVIIVFKVKEKPAVVGVTVVGNSGLRTQAILDALSVKAQTIFNASRLRLDEIAVRQLYQSKGFPDIMVSASSTVRKDGGIDVVFNVDEGVQNIVEKLLFEGVASVSQATLKGELTLKEKGLFQAGQFNEGKLEESRKAVEIFYKKRGYVDAKVADVRRETVAVEKGKAMRLTLTFVIEEGRRYNYGGMTFSGNTLFTTEQLAALVRQQPGGILNYQRLLDDQSRAADLYFENGYIFNGFKLLDSRDEESGTISYQLQVEERPQAHIEDIVFKGNTKTKDFVLRRLVPLEPGDVFSKTKVLEALKNLYNTQYFSSIVPEYEQGSKDLFVDLIISVEEQSTASIQFGLTYTPSASTGSFPIIGLVNWSDINFRGSGQTLALKTNLAIGSQDLTFSFSDDWLFGKRWSGAVDFSFKHESLQSAQDTIWPISPYYLPNGDPNPTRFPDPYTSYEEYIAAGKVIPDEYLMNYDTWTISLGYSTGYRFNTPVGTVGVVPGLIHELGRKTYDETLFRPYDPGISANLNTWLMSNTLYARVYLNDLDLWYNPSKGYYASQRFGLTGWFNGEINHFIRSDTRLDAFVTLLNLPVTDTWAFKVILGGHSKFSALLSQPWRDGVTASDSKLLAIDGTFIGRGWSTLSSLYGTAVWDNWIELRMPVVPNILSLDGFLSAALLDTDSGLLSPAGIVAGSGPYDAGKSLADMSLGNFAFSAGYGLRFIILQFPFRLYFAKRFVFDGGFKPASNQWDFVLSVTTSLD
ncbi:MAG: outer membrane protein assembly factor BamA [Spirochaetae bacterium HGW-Spirochaetae-7]|jgi:outer membrane protein insertion porin family|nr:MAG: outer membrane protein assembly factor BamA [Spirochaetae bacterium HGW-Spirochaetae-7]